MGLIQNHTTMGTRCDTARPDAVRDLFGVATDAMRLGDGRHRDEYDTACAGGHCKE
jgi:hypothetical protein